jgi:trk system potassium uptake protein TrkH
MGLRFFIELFSVKKLRSRVFNLVVWLIVLILLAKIMDLKADGLLVDTNRFLLNKILVNTLVILVFVIEISSVLQLIYRRGLNPSMLFISSFAIFILIGTVMLYFPNATKVYISPIDAFFTAASSVCLTGLMVIDMNNFTTFGLVIIMLLIQIGGFGIMTFAGLLAYAVAGGASFQSQLAFREMMNSDRLHNIMRFVYQVIVVTLFFETIGAVFIYFSLDGALFERKLDRVFFSVFHAISGFCNAGITTLSKGMNDPAIKFNYPFQLIIAFLFILGGLGFPIVFNLYAYLKIKTKNVYRKIFKLPMRDHIPRLININSRLALVVSGILTIIGLVAYIIFEQDASLRQHPTFTGKLVTSFFGAVTPRTAGFNTIDTTALAFPSIMIYMLMMWIGASPGSMGGGIKTTTLGVAVLNVLSIIQGKDRTEFSGAEISQNSIRRAFAIILISFAVTGVSIFLISIYDNDKGLLNIAFEAFAAFSTTGLSLGITTDLSTFSKFVLILTMFIGRVGVLTIFIAFMQQSQQLYYRYPKEEITF